MYRYNTIQYNTIQPYFRLNLSVLDIHLTGVSDSPEGTNRQLLCRTYALSDHFNCSPLHRRQSWGLGCRDHVPQSLSCRLQEVCSKVITFQAKWTNLHII